MYCTVNIQKYYDFIVLLCGQNTMTLLYSHVVKNTMIVLYSCVVKNTRIVLYSCKVNNTMNVLYSTGPRFDDFPRYSTQDDSPVCGILLLV